MPNLYMGRGGLDGLFGKGPAPAQNGPNPNPGGVGTGNGFGQVPGSPPTGGGPGFTKPPTGNTPPPMPTVSQSYAANQVAPTAVRATGDAKGYDPSYLQNLATSIGALFANPNGGSMSFNPLGNLSEISPSSGQTGNAPGFGEPLTWLQQALNGLGFSFAPQPPPNRSVVNNPNNGGGGFGGGGRRGGPINTL